MITIVAGCTRSGMTMTMQMLEAGGMKCAGEYPAFEPFGMGQTPWSDLDGQAVKAVDTHRFFPPRGDYRVIVCRRDHKQQAKSSAKMMSAFAGLPVDRRGRVMLQKSFERDQHAIELWAQAYPFMIAEFEETLGNPHLMADELTSFVDEPLNVDRMAAAVIDRSPDCYDGMLELTMKKNR